jgi:hypothetical protein
MKTTSRSEAPFLQLLLSWMAYQISKTMAAIRLAHRASHVAAAVAASGNPAGM